MQNIANIWVWIGFSIFVIIALVADTIVLGKHHAKGPHTSIRAALAWTALWIFCAFIFNGLLWLYLYLTTNSFIAHQKALEFFTGFLIEKSLSIDNLFAFYMIFYQFHIPSAHQQRIFAYGIWGAIIFRLLIILFGIYLINKFHWILYLLGVFLVITGIKIFFFEEKQKDLAAGWFFQWLKRHLRMTDELEGHRFFILKQGKRYATRLFVALIFIEFSDIIFAADSIPAIFAITRDPFIVWTSNIFAILGLRALYFVLAGMVDRFQLLKYGIAIILVFVGIKMISEPWLYISTLFSLGIVIGILVSFTLISIFISKPRE